MQQKQQVALKPFSVVTKIYHGISLLHLGSGASKGTPATQNASQKSSGDKNKEVRGNKV